MHSTLNSRQTDLVAPEDKELSNLAHDALRALESRKDDVWVCPGLHYLYAMVSGQAGPWGISDGQIEASGYRQEFRSQIDGLRRLCCTHGIRSFSVISQ